MPGYPSGYMLGPRQPCNYPAVGLDIALTYIIQTAYHLISNHPGPRAKNAGPIVLQNPCLLLQEF